MQLYRDSRWFVLRVRQLSTLIAAGVSLIDAIDVLAADDTQYRTLWLVTRSELINGSPPLIALRHIVPDALRGILNDLGHIPDLPFFLTRLADWVEHRLNRVQALGRQLIYPTVLVCALVGVGSVMVTQVLPQYLSLIPQGQTPPLGLRVGLLIADLFSNPYAGLFGLLIVGALVGGVVRIGYIGIRHFLGPRFRLHDGFSLLSVYLKSGIPLNQAMEILSNQLIPNVAWQPFCNAVLKSGDVAGSAAVFLQLNAYHSEMIRVGQYTGKLSELLTQVGIELREDDERRLDRRMGMVQPALYLLIGVLILGAAYMTLAPMSAILQT